MARSSTVLILALLATAPVAGSDPDANDSVRLLFAGDILLSREVEVELQHRNVSPWRNFISLFRNADWVGGNFEGAIGTRSACVARNDACFVTSESAVQLLKQAGFHGVTVENNHAGDLGRAGREHTRTSLQQVGLMAIDFDNSPQVVRLGETMVAFLSITTIPAADGRVQHVPSDEVADKLRLARQCANVVVVSIHWGMEFLRLPDSSQQTQARWLVERGADLIVGHHPHVIQPPECVEGRPVFFSLGNHVFDEVYPTTKEGLIADCLLKNGGLRCRGMRTRTGRGTSIPVPEAYDHTVDVALEGCATKVSVADLVTNGSAR